jgi:hypothetical protein
MNDERSNYSCNAPDVAFVHSTHREKEERDERILVLSPWTVQNICYEIIKNYMIINTPQSLGYRFTQKYDPDDLQTGIFLQIAYHYKDTTIQKRPGIYISRGPASFQFPTINQLTAIDIKESEKTKNSLVSLPLNVSVVGTNIGFTEQLAEYVFKIFLYHQENIRNDFLFRQFKLASIERPELYLESKDHFVVNIVLQSVFDMSTIIKGDDLKLKKVSYTVFTNCLEQPLLNQ